MFLGFNLLLLQLSVKFKNHSK